MAKSATIRLTKAKETPGCVVYKEDEVPGQAPIIGSLYVKKHFATGGKPGKASFNKSKETPGAVQFAEEEVPGQPPIIGSLYLKKYFAAAAASVDVDITPFADHVVVKVEIAL